jgi:hypothetical protein
MASNQFDQGLDPVLLQTNNPFVMPAYSPRTERSQLRVHFQPCDYSVICGRDNACSSHTGNRRFRVIASMFVEKYSLAACNKHKSTIATSIVTMIRQGGGSFCKYEDGAWFEVGDHYAHEKVSSLFHDMLHTQCRSSTKAKTTRWRDRRDESKTQNQQYGQQLDDEDTGLSDDFSMSSSCLGSSTDSLGFDNSLELDFFDIDVF